MSAKEPVCSFFGTKKEDKLLVDCINESRYIYPSHAGICIALEAFAWTL